jgi:hypothetical protein
MRPSDKETPSSRRDGDNVYYRVVDGCIAPLLDLALRLMEDEGCRRPADGGLDGKGD